MTTAGHSRTETGFARIGTSDPPIFFWRLVDSSVGWANAAGCSLWGAASSVELAGRKLDRAMPAVAKLQRLGLVLAEGASDQQDLVFWLPSGSRSLACWCRKIAAPLEGDGLVLTVLDWTAEPGREFNGSAPAAPALDVHGHGSVNGAGSPLSLPSRPTASAPPLPPEDAATLAEIARMIRTRNNGPPNPAAPVHAAPMPPAKSDAGPQLGAGEPELLGHLSHELRTPLNAIIGYGELLLAEQSGPLGSPKYRAYAGDMLAAAKHCLSLVNDLFDMTKLAAGERRPEFSEVDVNEAARTCLSLMAPIAAKANVQLSETLAPSLPLAILDRRGLRQILLNLLANAIKFTPPGGTVAVRSAYDVGVGLRLAVADTGAGMTGSGLEVARGEHERTEPGVAGLGLPISRNIASLNGGVLRVESQSGRGTEVTLFLPMNRLLLK